LPNALMFFTDVLVGSFYNSNLDVGFGF